LSILHGVVVGAASPITHFLNTSYLCIINPRGW
jgi:hypothetical protein